MSTHPDPEQLSAYIDGELTGTDRDDLEQHLTGCSDCSVTVRALRATLADMRALPAPVPSEQDQWALRSAISKARKRPAKLYRFAIATSGVAAVAIAIVAGLMLHTAKHTPASGAKAIEGAASLPLNSGSPAIEFDSTNYTSASAKQLLMPRVIAAPVLVAPPPPTSGRGGTTHGATQNSTFAAEESRYRSEIVACERQIFSRGAGGARATQYIVGSYDNTPAFFLIYAVVVSGKTKREMLVVQQSNCYIRLFLAPQ